MLLAVQNHQCERQLCCAPLQCGVQGAMEVQNFPQHCAKVCRIAGGWRQLVAGWARVGRQCVLACAGWGGWRREAGQCVDWVDSGTLVTSNIALCPHIAPHTGQWTRQRRRRWEAVRYISDASSFAPADNTAISKFGPAGHQRVCLLLFLTILRRSETRNL